MRSPEYWWLVYSALRSLWDCTTALCSGNEQNIRIVLPARSLELGRSAWYFHHKKHPNGWSCLSWNSNCNWCHMPGHWGRYLAADVVTTEFSCQLSSDLPRKAHDVLLWSGTILRILYPTRVDGGSGPKCFAIGRHSIPFYGSPSAPDTKPSLCAGFNLNLRATNFTTKPPKTTKINDPTMPAPIKPKLSLA